MKIIRAKDYKDMSRKAANIISAQVIMKPNCVLGLATGGTPVGTYAAAGRVVQQGRPGLLRGHHRQPGRVPRPAQGAPESYWSFMHTQPVRPCQHPPRGHPTCPTAPTPMPWMPVRPATTASSTSVGGIDLQLLGLGPNGHIGFNEPGEAF